METSVKLVVVDDNLGVISSIREHFNASDKVKLVASFSDGDEALNYLTHHTNEYDMVVMDVVLSRVDGITILEELKNKNISKKIIILSAYKDEMLMKEANKYGICSYILKPFSLLSLEKRINNVINDSSYLKNNNSKNLDLEITDLLHNLGIPSHLSGFKYIRESIMMIYKDKTISLITKDIYPMVADKYETTSSRVERAIRHAIEVSYLRGDYDLMDELFGYSVSSEKSRPTNSEFLLTIADRLKIETNL